ncbi:hypothetical protein OPT61_g1386 [Boeremia exigua]|uniref:Uncharacterized protein n=1 Tax=Boeremia exigua TaxID=749465 RepID=A0ACC2IQ92_9PLEO|nr:hypothetical protein OPT61_g1386 [Boeremia exigua]
MNSVHTCTLADVQVSLSRSPATKNAAFHQSTPKACACCDLRPSCPGENGEQWLLEASEARHVCDMDDDAVARKPEAQGRATVASRVRGRTIRLLNIEPGDIDSPLCCALQERSLDDDTTSYNALSYCWGIGESPVEITCNSQPLLITPNLHSVLFEYRRRGVNTPLWVDAVCIDQSNVAERTSQVRMMQAIYSQAARVVVWLGEAADTDAMAVEVLKAIYAPWATYRDPTSGRAIPLFTGQNDANHDANLAGRVPDAYFDALAAFLLRPWFSRIWIVQELVCARDLSIWCGEATFNEDFPILEAAAHMLTMHNCNTKTQLATTVLKDQNAQGVGRSNLMCAGRLWSFKALRNNGQSSILMYLLLTRCFKATEPRDKIFALIGLAEDIAEDFVDYSKSYKDVVQELSHMVLDGRIPTTSGSILDLLTCITRDEEDDLSGPSWVVDWLRLQDSLYTPLMKQYPSERPTISRDSEVRFLETDGGETLHAYGIVFDRIAHIVPSPVSMRQLVPQSEFLNLQHLPSFMAWHDEAMNVVATTLTDPEGVYRASGEPFYDAFWRTLCCNRSADKPTQPPPDDSGYVAWRGLIALHKSRSDIEAKFRRTCTFRRRLSHYATTAIITGLTYYFRRHKLLFVALPLTLPTLLSYVNKVWDMTLQILLHNLIQEFVQQSTQVQIDQRDFENSHSQWTQGRQFALTQQGRMGWVPLAARVGDNVGLFAGCRIPFVLRAFETGYKVVGDAYMHVPEELWMAYECAIDGAKFWAFQSIELSEMGTLARFGSSAEMECHTISRSVWNFAALSCIVIMSTIQTQEILTPLARGLRVSATLEINELVQQRLNAGKSVVHLGFGEATFPIQKDVLQAHRDASSDTSYLPVAGLPKLRESIAKFQTRRFCSYIKPDQVVVAPGSKPLLFALFDILDGDVLLPRPSWVSYEPQVLHAGKQLFWVETDKHDRHTISAESLKTSYDNAIASGGDPRIMLINSPSNPTGQVFDDSTIEIIHDFCRERLITLISDEIYSDISFSSDATPSPAARGRLEQSQLIITGGLSKTYSAGGWRVGFAIFPNTDFGIKVQKAILAYASECWSAASAPAQAAAAVAFDTTPEMDTYRQQVALTHKICTLKLYHVLKECGLDVPEPKGAFYVYPSFHPYTEQLERIGIRSSKQLSRWLIEQCGIAALPGEVFGEQDEGIREGRYRLRMATSYLYFKDQEDRYSQGYQLLCQNSETAKVPTSELVDEASEAIRKAVERLQG